MTYAAQRAAARPIRTFIAVTCGQDGEQRASFAASQTDWDYLEEGRSPCGKVTLGPTDNVIDQQGAEIVGLVHVRASKINAIINDGCSMLRHLDAETLEAQRNEYIKGRTALDMQPA